MSSTPISEVILANLGRRRLGPYNNDERRMFVGWIAPHVGQWEEIAARVAADGVSVAVVVSNRRGRHRGYRRGRGCVKNGRGRATNYCVYNVGKKIAGTVDRVKELDTFLKHVWSDITEKIGESSDVELAEYCDDDRRQSLVGPIVLRLFWSGYGFDARVKGY